MKTSSKKSAQERQDAKVAWLMMAPALLILSVIALYPVLRTFWLSLHEMSLNAYIAMLREAQQYVGR